MFVRAQKRLSGFSFLAHYTWSRFRTTSSPPTNSRHARRYMDAYNRELDWGSGSDVPHHFVVSVL